MMYLSDICFGRNYSCALFTFVCLFVCLLLFPCWMMSYLQGKIVSFVFPQVFFSLFYSWTTPTKTMVTLHNCYLNFWKILSGGLGRSSCTVITQDCITVIHHIILYYIKPHLTTLHYFTIHWEITFNHVILCYRFSLHCLLLLLLLLLSH